MALSDLAAKKAAPKEKLYMLKDSEGLYLVAFPSGKKFWRFRYWTIKESVQAQLRVVIKRTLRKYGYPPDMQQLATDTVMKQAQMIADELAG